LFGSKHDSIELKEPGIPPPKCLRLPPISIEDHYAIEFCGTSSFPARIKYQHLFVSWLSARLATFLRLWLGYAGRTLLSSEIKDPPSLGGYFLPEGRREIAP